ncbi:methyl-accepting chemotaxis protein [Paraburkholderia sp. HP33-1]|uniref:methyl-accepting chemotaxis protein n=1 Tax=Paraburkholderia sp. HP33-1 TaxID=2883243 RepID=UPI001F3CAF3B|nr:methyl-accepting chemotaxis protein [Paraburkholderia sp. HP33-1]
MRFERKLIACFAVPAAIFTIAVTACIWGLTSAQAEFERYIDVDQKIAGGFEEMYADGLQMGQALRNVLLKPTDATGFKNFDAAEKGYEAVARATAAYASGTSEAASFDKLSTLRAAHQASQKTVLDAIRSNDLTQANQLLVNEETPAWRKLRGALLEDIERTQAQTKIVRTNAKAHADNSVRLAIALAAVALLCAAAMTWVLTRTVRREIGGDPNVARTALKDLAQGDLTTKLSLYPDDRTSMMVSLDAMRVNLAGLVSNIKATAESISGTSGTIAESSLNLSQRTDQQAASLEETAASMEQLTTTVKQNVDHAREATTLAATAADVADRGNSVVRRMQSTMGDITTSSDKIADITSMIEGIAFQTNILALNAAVEAARAGEHGRGFAVVATEVRSLAQRAGNASKDIKSLIERSSQTVKEGMVHAGEVAHVMGEVEQAIRRVATLNGEISTASHEQGNGIEQVNLAIGQMDQVTQQNAALVGHTAQAAQSMNEQAAQLKQVTAVFRLPA